MRTDELDNEEFLYAMKAEKNKEEIRRKALGNSLSKETTPYGKKKKVANNKLRDGIIAVAIVVVTLVSGVKLVDAVTGPDVGFNAAVSDTKIEKTIDQEIDKKIQEYEKAMGIYGGEDTRIEVFRSRNDKNPNDPNVDYDYYNFTNDIIDASRAEDPETEVRCALIGAYKVINEPYRESCFNILFDNLKEQEEFINNTGFDMSGDVWKMLGYKDREDFQLHAREDTKMLKTINSRSNNGKGM